MAQSDRRSSNDATNSSTTAAAFKHARLEEVEVDAIRLCTILPGQQDDPVSCHVTHTRLSLRPSYEAISYTWGNLTIVGSILCNGSELPTTQNLLDTLRHLRLPESPRTIWIDQICINQKNLDERAQQVAIMRDIYHDADRTLIWLGRADEGSDAAMDLIPVIASLDFSNSDGSRPWVSEWPSLGLPPITDPVWVSFGRLMKRPWFHRTWTLQEAAVAREAFVLCGMKQHPWPIWETLIDTPIRSLLTIPENLTPNPTMLDQPHNMTAFGQVSTIKGIRRGLRSPDPNVVVDALTLFSHGRRLRAKDPKDKVFALLRITSKNFQTFMLAPDYHRTVAEIYLEAAVKILVSSDSLDILYSAGCSTQQHELPSWVPDWSVPVYYPNFGRYGGFHACAEGWGRQGFAETRDLDAGLQVRGKLLATVSYVGQAFRSGEQDFQYDQLIEHFLPRMKHQFAEVERCIRLADEQPSYPTGEDPSSVCKQVLVGGVRMRPLHSGGTRPWTRLNAEEAKWDFDCYIEYTKVAMRLPEFPEGKVPMNREIFGIAQRYLEAFDLATSRRVFAMTDDGYMGLVPSGTKPGDQISIILGCDVPFVIRRTPPDWRLVGECYVHGLMDGEAMKMDQVPVESIWLI